MTSWRILASSVRFTRHSGVVSAEPPFPSSQRSIRRCPAGQLHNSKEVGRTKTKDLSSYFLERGGAKRRGGQFGETLRRSDHPGCAASVASRHSFDGASTPPLRGGEYYATTITRYCT